MRKSVRPDSSATFLRIKAEVKAKLAAGGLRAGPKRQITKQTTVGVHTAGCVTAECAGRHPPSAVDDGARRTRRCARGNGPVAIRPGSNPGSCARKAGIGRLQRAGPDPAGGRSPNRNETARRARKPAHVPSTEGRHRSSALRSASGDRRRSLKRHCDANGMNTGRGYGAVWPRRSTFQPGTAPPHSFADGCCRAGVVVSNCRRDTQRQTRNGRGSSPNGSFGRPCFCGLRMRGAGAIGSRASTTGSGA